MRKLIKIFTRDFSQWTNEIITNAYVNDFPIIWGKGLEDQIVYYSGRSFVWYRYEDDFQALGNFMVQKSLDDKLFSVNEHQVFRSEVDNLRKLLNVSVNEIQDVGEYLKKIISIYKKMYPLYTFGVFMAGAWRDNFLKFHNDQPGQKVMQLVYESRVYSEGLVKECDNFVREMLENLAQKINFPKEYIKLLGIKEINNLIDGRKISPDEIKKREDGYVYLGGEIYPTNDLNNFLASKNILVEQDVISNINVLKGTVACKGQTVKGKVQIIFNSNEIKLFKAGNIFVTPMTSPDYLMVMKRALAIITDEGGISCHAAITSRELGVPCIIGTKIATKVLKDGDIVEVDADKGIVRKI